MEIWQSILMTIGVAIITAIFTVHIPDIIKKIFNRKKDKDYYTNKIEKKINKIYSINISKKNYEIIIFKEQVILYLDWLHEFFFDKSSRQKEKILDIIKKIKKYLLEANKYYPKLTNIIYSVSSKKGGNYPAGINYRFNVIKISKNDFIKKMESYSTPRWVEKFLEDIEIKVDYTFWLEISDASYDLNTDSILKFNYATILEKKRFKKLYLENIKKSKHKKLLEYYTNDYENMIEEWANKMNVPLFLELDCSIHGKDKWFLQNRLYDRTINNDLYIKYKNNNHKGFDGLYFNSSKIPKVKIDLNNSYYIFIELEERINNYDSSDPKYLVSLIKIKELFNKNKQFLLREKIDILLDNLKYF